MYDCKRNDGILNEDFRVLSEVLDISNCGQCVRMLTEMVCSGDYASC